MARADGEGREARAVPLRQARFSWPDAVVSLGCDETLPTRWHAACVAPGMHHDDTRIYGKSLDLLSLCADVIERMPAGYAFLSDQLRRASSSITLNFSEGSGRTSKADRARFFMMARGSAKEVSAILDVGHRFRVVRDDERERGRDLCDHLAAMLYRFH